ncbi:MAG: hypothetical protein IJ746_03345 [Ruminococcus sp.]|nr:hypothetical protein [Ruminococcus sp.]
MKKIILFSIIAVISLSACSHDPIEERYKNDNKFQTTTTKFSTKFNYDYGYDYKEDLFSYLDFSNIMIKKNGSFYYVYATVKNRHSSKTLQGYVKAVIYNGSELVCTRLLPLPKIRPGDSVVADAVLTSDFSGKYTRIDIQDSTVVDW